MPQRKDGTKILNNILQASIAN